MLLDSDKLNELLDELDWKTTTYDTRKEGADRMEYHRGARFGMSIVIDTITDKLNRGELNVDR